MQISWEYANWLAKAPINKDFPHRVLSLQDHNRIHKDYIAATNFLGRLYQAHEDLVMADPANHITHLWSHDKNLERVRKCFKRLETFMVSEKVSDVQVNETSTEGEPTPQQINQGESNNLTGPCPTWFWSLTEKFK